MLTKAHGEEINPKATLSVEEACDFLGIGKTLGYRLAREGKLPTIRLGRKLVVVRSKLERMLDEAATKG